MTDPKEQQQEEPDELDLDAETVKDLEPDEKNADDIRGGNVARTQACGGGPANATQVMTACAPYLGPGPIKTGI